MPLRSWPARWGPFERRACRGRAQPGPSATSWCARLARRSPRTLRRPRRGRVPPGVWRAAAQAQSSLRVASDCEARPLRGHCLVRHRAHRAAAHRRAPRAGGRRGEQQRRRCWRLDRPSRRASRPVVVGNTGPVGKGPGGGASGRPPGAVLALPARHRAAAGALAGQPAGAPVRGPAVQGRGQDG